MTDQISADERQAALAPLFDAGWALADNRDALQKTFVFDKFYSCVWMDDPVGHLGRKMEPSS